MNEDIINEIEQEMKKVAQPLSALDIDKESKYATKKRQEFAESFFKNVVDYSKWITSITLAALTLIGTIISVKGGVTNTLFTVSLVLIFISLIVSVGTIYCVLKFWQRNYDYYFDMSVYFSMLWSIKKGLNLYTPSNCEEQKKKMLQKAAENTLFSMPKLFSILLSVQIIFFFFGLIFFIFGVNFQ